MFKKGSKKVLISLFLLFLVTFIVINVQGSDDPNLGLSEEDIYFSKLNPELGEDVAIYAIIHNFGPRSKATVRFYEGDNKILIGEDEIVIPKKSSAVAKAYQQFTYGSHKIYVSIEGTSPSDIDLSNNEVCVTTMFSESVSALEIKSGIATIEEGFERIIPIKVEAFYNLDNVNLTVIYQEKINVTLILSQQNIKAGKTKDFFIKIKVPHLNGDEIYDNKTILIQASNDEFTSNIAELKISIHPSVENNLWWSASVAAAAGTVGIFTFIGSTEVGKYKFLSFILPLYTKLTKDEILDHYTRGKIHGYILANPGEHYNSIRKALDISNGSFAYHLKVLEREGVIKSKRDGVYKRFYPSGMPIPTNGSHLKEIQKLIIKKIKETPGISQKEIATFLGLASSTIHYHVQFLIGANMIKSRRMGRKIKYFPNNQRSQDHNTTQKVD